jgi:hypothetical protein
MRRLILKFVLFIAVIEGLGRIDLVVLLAGLALTAAALICSDLLFDSASSK